MHDNYLKTFSKDPFDSAEPDRVVKEGRDFVDTLKAKFSRRQFRTHVPDLFGELVSLNRLIKPLEPPQEVTGKISNDLGLFK